MDLAGQHVDNHESHEHASREIGISNSAYYFVNSQEFHYGIHLHYIYYFTDSKFGIGGGYERIFDEEGHNTFGVIGTYNPIKRLEISISPGLTFEDENPSIWMPAFHIELTYNFHMGKFHINPVFGYAITREDQHLSAGIHLGFGF